MYPHNKTTETQQNALHNTDTKNVNKKGSKEEAMW